MNYATIPLILAVLTASSADGRAQVTGLDRSPPRVVSPFKLVAQGPALDGISNATARGNLKSAWKKYQVGVREFQRGQLAKSPTRSARHYRSAARTFELVKNRFMKLAHRYRNDASAKSEAARLTRQAAAGAIESYFELASHLTSRGSYKRALDAVQSSLRLDRQDRRAQKLRALIQLSAAAAGR